MRLINADELVKQLKASTMSNGTLINTNTMLAVVGKMPTAYDVDKVVEELESAENYYYHDKFDEEGDLIMVKSIEQSVAIEIVKHGSVSDDVCEWKYTKEIMDNAEFTVGCNPNALKRGIVPNNFSYHNFKYCPYCGKKIKAVE